MNYEYLYKHEYVELYVLIMKAIHMWCRSPWPCGLRLIYEATRLLRSRVRIPLREYKSVSHVCYVKCR